MDNTECPTALLTNERGDIARVNLADIAGWLALGWKQPSAPGELGGSYPVLPDKPKRAKKP